MNNLHQVKQISVQQNSIQNTKKQLKLINNKNCIVKLSVNQLITKNNFNKQKHLNKSQLSLNNQQNNLNSNNQNSQQSIDSTKNNNKSKQTVKQVKIVKTFQQMYYQKIKQLKLQQNNNINVQNHKYHPHTCKNIVTLKPNNKILTNEPQSTKNNNQSIKIYNQSNKENISTQQFNNHSHNHSHNQNVKFFKNKNKLTKKLDNTHNSSIQRSSTLQKKKQDKVQNVQNKIQPNKNKISQNKQKKILKLRRPSKLQHQLQQKKDKRQGQFNFIQNKIIKRNKSSKKCQNALINKNQTLKNHKIQNNKQITKQKCHNNNIQELISYKLLTPCSSNSSINNKQNTTQNKSQISDLINQIINNKFNHDQHEHIWNGTQCFLSQNQFYLLIQDFLKKQLRIKQNNSNQQIQFYINKIWEHLGGDLYGGVVRKNLIQFLNIIFNYGQQINQQITSFIKNKSQLSTLNYFNDIKCFIDASSLKLITLNQQMIKHIHKFYFPLKITKIASQIHSINLKNYSHQSQVPKPSLSSKSNRTSSQKKQKLSNEKGQSQNKKRTQQKITTNQTQENLISLQNNAYLDTVSIKDRYQQMSPTFASKDMNYENEINFTTDFSPKMSAQQYEPFRSTILIKQNINEYLSDQNIQSHKLQTQQQNNLQTHGKQNKKPLLSIDINLGQGIIQKLYVYENQNPYQISLQLQQKYNIDQELRQKFQKLLKNHLSTLLFKIQQVSEQLFEDSLQLPNQPNLRDFILMDKQ